MKTEGIFQFGGFRIDAGARTLRRGNDAVALSRRAFDVLLYLVQNPGRILTHEELLKNVWPDTYVDENSLAQSVSALRRALGEKPGDNSYILTLPGRGYQFVAPVRTLTSMSAVAVADSGVAAVSAPSQVVLQQHTIRTSVTVEEKTQPGPWGAGRSWAIIGIGTPLLVIAILAFVGYSAHLRAARRLTERDTVVLADFTNRTGDPVFDDTLKTALDIALAQSPFINPLSENRIRATLRLMARPPETRIAPEVAREICQRTGGKAYIAGSIVQLGSQYVVALDASNCQSGDTMAKEQDTAGAKEKVLDALGRATSKLRTELGESLATVQKFDLPLVQVTTPSLEALKAMSEGEKFYHRNEPASALPCFQRALDLDPNFAMAYEELGNAYISLNQIGRARGYFAKAFSLRDRTSEIEHLQIAAEYYGYGTGELDKALEAMQEDIEYKHSSVYAGMADIYARLGQWENAEKAARTLLARDPESRFAPFDIASDELAQQNFNGARQTIQQAQARGNDGSILHVPLYLLAFLQSDSEGMAKQQQWFAGQRGYENTGISLASDTEAFAGHMKEANRLTRLAADSAIRADNKEDAAMYLATLALQQAAYGKPAEARDSAAEALRLDPDHFGVAVQAALALAMSGQTARAGTLAHDLRQRFPLNTQVQEQGAPMIDAQLQLDRGKPQDAIDTLRAGLAIEFANTPFTSNDTSCLYPAYVRGQAYLAAAQGLPAAAEFQKILDHSGIVGNCWTGALARLGLARANALQSRTSPNPGADAARAKALAAYKDFLILWKDADPEIPILNQARAEYAKLSAGKRSI